MLCVFLFFFAFFNFFVFFLVFFCVFFCVFSCFFFFAFLCVFFLCFLLFFFCVFVLFFCVLLFFFCVFCFFFGGGVFFVFFNLGQLDLWRLSFYVVALTFASQGTRIFNLAQAGLPRRGTGEMQPRNSPQRGGKLLSKMSRDKDLDLSPPEPLSARLWPRYVKSKTKTIATLFNLCWRTSAARPKSLGFRVLGFRV